MNPEADDLLLNAVEVQYGWEITNWTLRRAVQDGRVRRRRRPGYQAYFGYSDVVAAFGDPVHSPFRPSGTEKSAKGGYQQGFDFVRSQAA